MGQLEIVGGSLAVVASVVSNLGVNIQKYSHSCDSKLPLNKRRPYLRRPLWWFGLVLVASGSIGDFAAFGFAAQSLVAALGGGSTLVANVLMAHFLNGEALYRTDMIGVVFVIAGVVLIACISDANVEYPLPELEQRFVRTGRHHQHHCWSIGLDKDLNQLMGGIGSLEFVVYIVLVGMCVVSMLATIKGSVANRLKNQINHSRKRQKKLMMQYEIRLSQMERRLHVLEEQVFRANVGVTSPERKQSTRSLATNASANSISSNATSGDTATASTTGSSEEEIRMLQQQQDQLLRIQEACDLVDGVASRNRVPYYYAICSGIVGAISVLFAKCFAVMVSLTLKGDNQFQYGLTYVFLGGMFCCILVQTHLLNMATSLGEIMTVFPTFQAFWIIFSVIGGTVFYESEKSFTVAKWVLYPIAIVSIAGGVVLLVQHDRNKRKQIDQQQQKLKRQLMEEELADEEGIFLISDATLSSPLLPLDSIENDEGYLNLPP